ncbi:MAG: hypothetical protein CMF37_14875 [Leeuwenhoekiella sp.]|nr:hypothetical protein [Leeuwenhoekiella sp.]MBQ50102.1 hypothetical protein [Leeuwenhoekiella sp.]MBQ50299.1 hypothetical protein [Leeuwenhoekiella sp.]MBQ50496.1 hypothetical protein [Leeuwenhoekiella sp.]|tara:strand:+ start:21221 stop:24121 length:2901 start_codon:yes stop_codon:yes gene_type:complete
MTDIANRVPGVLRSLSKAQFEANREHNRGIFASSGYIEPGRHWDNTDYVMGEGLFTFSSSVYDSLYMGRSTFQTGGGGVSESDYPIFNIDGIVVHLRGTNHDTSYHESYDEVKYDTNRILLPPAPMATPELSTTTTKDYQQGDHVVVGNNIYVCIHPDGSTAGSSLTNTTLFETRDMVSREDLVGMEVFLVELKQGKVNVVYPYGNVQNGEKDWNGFDLQNDLMHEDYSKFGSWQESWPVDQFTHEGVDVTRVNGPGFGVRWSDLTAEERNVWMADPDNNIYEEDGRYYQWQYRIRSVPSLGQQWKWSTVEDAYTATFISAADYDVGGVLQFQGYSLYTTQYRLTGGRRVLTPRNSYSEKAPGIWSLNSFSSAGMSEGACYFLPIAKVTRLNQGGYHPVYNPLGTATFRKQTENSDNPWYIDGVYLPESIADCFKIATGPQEEGIYPNSGTHVSGKSGHPLQYVHDIIRADMVDDLRLPAIGAGIDVEDLAYDYVFGKVRGWEPLKLMNVFKSTIETVDSNAQITLLDAPDNEFRTGCWLYNVTKDLLQPGIRYDNSNSYWSIDKSIDPQTILGQWGSSGNVNHFITDGWEVNDEVIVISFKESDVSMQRHITTDVIATPQKLLDLLLSYGVTTVPCMDWIPSIPDNTSKEYKGRRKIERTSSSLLITDNLGENWLTSTSYLGRYIGFSNSSMHVVPENQIQLLQYRSSASVVKRASLFNGSTRRLPFANAAISGIWATTSADIKKGGLVNYSLTGQVPVGDGSDPLRYRRERIGLLHTRDGYVLDGTWTQDLAHAELDSLDPSNGVKFHVSLGHQTKNNLIYPQLTFKQLYYETGDKPVTIIDLSTPQTVNLEIGEHFKLINNRNSFIEGLVLATRQTITNQTWGEASFDLHRVNYDDGNIYREDGSFVGQFELAPITRHGDDGEFEGHSTSNVAFDKDLNGNTVAYGVVLGTKPIGFLPKTYRR